MMDITTWLTYFLLMTAIVYTPGPMTLFSMSSSVRNGFAATLPAIAGGSSAYMVQMAVVYFGLGVVVQNSLVIFNIIKWTGVAYLVVLGVKNWRLAVKSLHETRGVRAASVRRQYSLGFLTGMSNPKSVIVFTVIFPQFIDPARYTADFLTLAATFAVLQICSAVSYALFGARVFAWMYERGLGGVQNKVTAVVLFLAGGVLAVSEK